MLTRFKYSAEVTHDSANMPATSPIVSSKPRAEYAANEYSISMIFVTIAITP